MGKINLEKLIVDFFRGNELLTYEEKKKVAEKVGNRKFSLLPLGAVVRAALREQGLEYKDGAIVAIEKPKNIKFDEEPKEKKWYFQNILTNEEDELRSAVKELLHKNGSLGSDSGFWSKEEIEQLKKDTDEGSKKIMDVMREIVFSKEPDIDAMVEEYRKTVPFGGDCEPIRTLHCKAYRKGLEDMFKKLKGEQI